MPAKARAKKRPTVKKFFLFHQGSKRHDPEFLKAFVTRKQLEDYIVDDIKMLKKAYPRTRWQRSDYMVAKRIKCPT